MIIQVVLTIISLYLIAQVVSQPVFSKLTKFGSLVVVAGGILFVFRPEVTNSIAHFLGVGRGADLFLYLSISAGSVVLFRFYLRIRSLELRNVEVIRQLALQQFYINDRNSVSS
jgi:hypothetical protein